MKLRFVEITKRDGKETKEVIYKWDDVPESKVVAICQNFMDGFLYAMSINKRTLRYNAVMIRQGWCAQTWRYHDSDSGKKWCFENGKGQYITRWDERNKKK